MVVKFKFIGYQMSWFGTCEKLFLIPTRINMSCGKAFKISVFQAGYLYQITTTIIPNCQTKRIEILVEPSQLGSSPH
jgi:hypothetical protein